MLITADEATSYCVPLNSLVCGQFGMLHAVYDSLYKGYI